MKNLFNCFYENNDNETLKTIWNDQTTLFVFDTNVLLDLYSFSPKSRSIFFQTLDLIKDQLWIPHHVGLEYQRNRVKVVIERRRLFTDLESQIKTINDAFNEISRKVELYTEDTILKKQFKNKNNSNIPNTWQEVLNSLKKNLDFCQKNAKDLDQDQLYPNQHDPIREKLEGYFSKQYIGKPLYDEQSELDKFYKDGEERYKHKRPPGYEDIGKEKNSSKDHPTFWFNGLTYQRKFGDLLIFKEIIAYTKENKRKNVIFISEDKKEDWRVIIEYAGKKNLGARPELKSEFSKETDAESFLVFSIVDFVNKTHEFKTTNSSREIFSLQEESEIFDKIRNQQKKDVEHRYQKYIEQEVLHRLQQASTKQSAHELQTKYNLLERTDYINDLLIRLTNSDNELQEIISRYEREPSKQLSQHLNFAIESLKISIRLAKVELQRDNAEYYSSLYNELQELRNLAVDLEVKYNSFL